MTFRSTVFRFRRFFLIVGAAAVLALGTMAEIVQGQLLGISGSEEAFTARWQTLNNQPPFQTDTALLLTDGTVMMHEYNSSNWWRLTPDNTGSYLNGTWSQLASMQRSYAPLYFASAVLPDGRVLVEGGEYNHLHLVETNQGAIYDPTTNVWTVVNPPSGWSTIGDSPAIILQDGTFMMGQGGFASKRQVLFNAPALTWSAVGTGKADTFSEEGFAILPNGSVLVVDTANGTNSELYDPSTGQWTSAGSTMVPLVALSEMGPEIQRPDGTVVAFGALPHTSIYNPSTGTWARGPDFPAGNDMADGPGSLLPDGNVLVYASPGVFQGTGTFFVFDGTSFTQAPPTQSSGDHQSWEARQLLLPTGQVLWLMSDGRTIDVELYTSSGMANPAWAPTITAVPGTLTRGNSYPISGTQFNGLSVGSDYGDNAQMASNYPLVRITNETTRHVFYARTHDHSTMGIATGSAIVSTTFDVPANAETGPSRIVVVANGIPSKAKRVTIQ